MSGSVLRILTLCACLDASSILRCLPFAPIFLPAKYKKKYRVGWRSKFAINFGRHYAIFDLIFSAEYFGFLSLDSCGFELVLKRALRAFQCCQDRMNRMPGCRIIASQSFGKIYGIVLAEIKRIYTAPYCASHVILFGARTPSAI